MDNVRYRLSPEHPRVREPNRDREGAEEGKKARGKRQEVGRAVPAVSELSRDRKGADSTRYDVRCALIALLVAVTTATGCSDPEPAAEPVATSEPVAAVAAKPTTAPAALAPAERTDARPVVEDGAPPLGDRACQIPSDGWLHIERLEKDVEGGWLSGHSPKPNKIVIETKGVLQFSMDVSQFPLDWSKRVWVRINSSAFELTHKRDPVIHLRQTPVGAWELVDPNEE